ncbi:MULTISPECIES: transposase [unclassified Frankia]|uniref:transposase n=1 Tax=unclassified Frankia TaxID=2632575 RepID=UPI001EF4E685|nr:MULTISPECIES: transposase [unclassified Frankia]
MSLQPRPWPEVPPLTAQVAQAAFPKGNLAMRIRDELGAVYDDERFMGAFGVRGRPGISPGQLMMVTVLQFSENLTDRQAADAVRDRVSWKFALGLDLDDAGFDASVLSEFRSRLVAGDLATLALDALLERLAAEGLVKARGRARTDSTHVLGAIRHLCRLELAGETLRAALEALASAAPDWLTGVIDASWQVRYGARVDNLHLPESETKRTALMSTGLSSFSCKDGRELSLRCDLLVN